MLFRSYLLPICTFWNKKKHIRGQKKARFGPYQNWFFGNQFRGPDLDHEIGPPDQQLIATIPILGPPGGPISGAENQVQSCVFLGFVFGQNEIHGSNLERRYLGPFVLQAHIFQHTDGFPSAPAPLFHLMNDVCEICDIK